MSMGKQVPPSLLQQIAEGKRQEINLDSFNNFDQGNKQDDFEEPPQPPVRNQFIPNNHISRVPPQQFHRQQPPPNKFSPQYASYIGVKPRAQASARIGMGGAF